MKHLKVYRFLITISMLSLLHGCRYSRWFFSVFNQGRCVDIPIDTVTEHIRSVHVYDELSPLAHFDALWLSWKVRLIYMDIYADKRGLSCCQHDELYEEQQQENTAYISFYVLSAVTASYGSADLSDINAEWVPVLDIDGCIYKPVSIKEVEVPSEYQFFLGTLFNRYKKKYLIRFNAIKNDGTTVITSTANKIILRFNGADRFVELRWFIDTRGELIPESLYHTPRLAKPFCCF